MTSARAWLLGASVALVVATAAGVTVAWLDGAWASKPAPVRGAPLVVLQLNLCNSGLATCYTGRSVATAAAVIRARRPAVVTLDEICRADLAPLTRAMAGTGRPATVASAFKAAADRDTGGPFRCRNGQPYGIGVIARYPPGRSGYRTYSGVYPDQDPNDPEERVWVCVHVAGEPFACGTHTASTSTTVALAQCRNLLNSALPAIGAGRSDPVVVGADLNLPVGHSPEPQLCVPAGYRRADDGARQDVVASAQLTVRARSIIDMHGTTDHPGLLVELAGQAGR